MTTAVSTIVKLNQESIDMLKAKHYSKAASLLTKAVADLKLVLACDSSQNLTSEELSFTFDLNMSSAAAGVADNEDPFIFETPVRVTALITEDVVAKHTEHGSASNTNETLKMLSFALVFNLAIAFHLGALHHKSATTALLQIKKRLMKALAFYNLAASMLETSSFHTPAGIMESVAIANNQAHVYQLLREHDQADECYTKVLSYIIYAADVGQSDGILHLKQFFASAITKLAPTANAA